jgi:hypothetical protein
LERTAFDETREHRNRLAFNPAFRPIESGSHRLKRSRREVSMFKAIVLAAALAAISTPSFAVSTGYYAGESSRASAKSHHKIAPKKVKKTSHASTMSKMNAAPAAAPAQ